MSDLSAWMGNKTSLCEDGRGLRVKPCEDDNVENDPFVAAAPFADEESSPSRSSQKRKDRNRSHERNTYACLSKMVARITSSDMDAGNARDAQTVLP